MTQEDFQEEVEAFRHDLNVLGRRVQYFAYKRNLWVKKYNEKCAEVKELKKQLAQYEETV